MSKQNPTTLAAALAALFEQTEQRIRDGVRAPATLEMQRGHARWLLAELGARTPLRSVDEPTIERLTARPAPPARWGPSTLKKRLSTLRGALMLAHRRRWIARVPAFPEVIAPWRPRKRFLRDVGEARRLFDALPRHRGEWMWLALWTGQHASDVERMTWADVSLDEHAPWFLRRNTKNRVTPRRFAMPRALLRVLQDAYARDRPRPEDRIVRPWPGRNHTMPLKCYQLGLAPLAAIDLRHTLAAWLVHLAGGITAAILELFGHSSPAMMARTYAHALPIGLTEVTDALDAFAGEAPELPRAAAIERLPPRRADSGARSKTPRLAQANASGATRAYGQLRQVRRGGR